MSVEQEVRTAREAVGVFSRPEDLQNATVAAGAIVASGGTLVAGLAAAHWQAERAVSAARFWPNGSAITMHVTCKTRWIVEACCCG